MKNYGNGMDAPTGLAMGHTGDPGKQRSFLSASWPQGAGVSLRSPAADRNSLAQRSTPQLQLRTVTETRFGPLE
jgi:hypothetical protein